MVYLSALNVLRPRFQSLVYNLNILVSTLTFKVSLDFSKFFRSDLLVYKSDSSLIKIIPNILQGLTLESYLSLNGSLVFRLSYPGVFKSAASDNIKRINQGWDK